MTRSRQWKLHGQETDSNAVIELFLGLCHSDILQFRQKKLDYRVAIASTINRYRSTNRIFEEEWPDDAAIPKSPLNTVTRHSGCICFSHRSLVHFLD